MDESKMETEIESVSSNPTQEEEDAKRYLKGFRLIVAVLGLGIILFLPTAEASIVSTSLVTISEDIGSYDRSSWIITSYLLTYTGCLIVWSKITGVIGLRPALLWSAAIFIPFSGACGAAKNVEQLITFRAFQGIGASGLYSVSTIGMFQLVPPRQYSQINSIAACFTAVWLLIGPVVGGAISQTGDWRWIFYMVLPIQAISIFPTLLVLPSRFPLHCEPKVKTKPQLSSILNFFKKIDALGTILLLGASALLVTVLEEGGVQLAWRSAVIITCAILSGILWLAFIFWERTSGRDDSSENAMFPRRFFGNQIFMANLFGLFVSGVPVIVAVIELPQRYQIVNAASPLSAGVRLLAYAAPLPFGIVFANTLTGKYRVPFIYSLSGGAILQTVGFALQSTLPNTLRTWPGQYGYSVITGLGMGMSMGTYYIMTPISVGKKDQHLAVGAGLQARLLGSALGIAIVNNVLNNYLEKHLPPSQLVDLRSSTASLSHYPIEVQRGIREVYGEGFNLQMRVSIAFCAAQFVVVGLIARKKALRIDENGKMTGGGL
ncbi:hypothetical protein HYFRA_00003289 [Hymenoscyphus fraxineus]|uniref:Major facilitator superfamily (MFS) profile domain-containing protein n=1 Tax=Hymenoscyphus fraxineus TaxID=746836 RepID=A0A9N9KTC4_9HELO|nr:hypothetical protein HYFRA_00003289 [Hymenoscyphus fraxineus]